MNSFTDPELRKRLLKDSQVGIRMLTDFKTRLLADPKLSTRLLGSVAVLLVVLIVLVMVDIASHGAAAKQQVKAATPTPATSPAQIELWAYGQSKTAPFHLSGNYRVEFNMVTACSYYGSIKRVDGRAYLDGIDVVTVTKPGPGAVAMHHVPAADYYLEMITPTGCLWYVTLRTAA
jgi:hypothetical protein